MAHITTSSNTSDITCAEAISFMHLLHGIPAEPSINPCPQLECVDSEAYSLPFERERDLVNTLAFLSNIREDPSYVPALCMRENPVTNGLEVIIAVNQAHYGDGRTSLNDIKGGFERIFYSLSEVLQSADAENIVFSKVVEMCSTRIRERMRYAPQKRNKPRQTIKKLLEETLLFLGGKFTEFRQKGKMAIQFIDSWQKHQTQQRLCDVVEALVQLSRISNLRQILASIPNTSMGPSERKNLLKMIQRVARYREAARYLYRTARKYCVTRSMTIVPVRLPEGAFHSPSVEHAPNFLNTLARLQAANRKQSNIKQVARLLGLNGQTAEELFAKQYSKTISEGKIHAEMQLVFYLETNHPEPKPRVIASSKMACFLCNAFLCQVAKIYTKRCHGRLYPGWRLPIFPSASSDMERIFAKTLESHIRISIGALLLRQRRTFFPQPSESTLWTMKPSVTTVNTINGITDVASEKAPRSESHINITHESKSVITTEVAVASEEESGSKEQAVASLNSVALEHRSQLVSLQRGTNNTIAICAPGVIPIMAGPLLVQLEYSISQSGRVQSPLKCSLEWLAPEDAYAVKNNSNACIVNVEAMKGELTIPTANLQALYLATGEDLLKLDLSQ